MSAILLSASLAIPAATGILLVLALCPFLNRDPAGRLFAGFAGIGIGIGLATCLAFLCLMMGMARLLPVVDLAGALLAGLGWYLLSRRPAGDVRPSPVRPWSRLEFVLGGIALLELIASAASFLLTCLKEPHGRWDAWLIWNMHARFLFRGGDHWADAFASGLDWSHWDYPLLLPLAITRSWNYLGGEQFPVPALIAGLFTLLTLGLLCSSLGFLKSRGQGYLGAMVLMGTPFFIVMGAAQFADIPLAFFVLTTLALLMAAAQRADGKTGTLLLAGFAAGLAAWTKNEGLLFLLVTVATLFGTTFRAGKARTACARTAAFLAGALPVLAVVAVFKLAIAPSNDLMAGFSSDALSAKLFDIDRYGAIARAFFLTGLSFTQGLVDVRVGMRLNPGAVSLILLAVYLFFAGVRIDRETRPGLVQTGATLLLMLAGYFFVYVLTPLDLTYHLITSLNRLMIQFWPAAILLVFMIARTPEESADDRAAAPVTPPPKARPAKGRKPKRPEEAA